MPVSLTQSPAPGTLLIRHAGDSLTFTLGSSDAPAGHAFLRTNLRQAAVQRAETIAAVESGSPPPGLDWEDLPMLAEGPGLWSLTLPLPDVGSFEAKAYLLPAGQHVPVWPGAGGNVRVKVEPIPSVL